MADVQKMTELFQQLSTSTSSEERASTASKVAGVVKSGGPASLESCGITNQLKNAMCDMSNHGAREGACQTLKAVVEAAGPAGEPFLLPMFAVLLDRLGDKQAPVRTAAEATLPLFVDILNPYSMEEVVEMLFEGMAQAKTWQTKVGALNTLKTLAARAPRQIARQLPGIVPQVTQCFADAKEQVKTAAQSATYDAFKVNGNRDIDVFIPALVSCIGRPAETTDCIHKLAATTFVQQVESPPLAIIVPLLVRGLRERATPIKRKACVIIDNMAKLVDVPSDAAPFLPRLLPELDRVKEEVADPECRSVAARAHATLIRVGGEGKQTVPRRADPSQQFNLLKSAVPKVDKLDQKTKDHVASRVAQAVNHRHFTGEDFAVAVLPFVKNLGVSEKEVNAALEKLASQASEEAEKLDRAEMEEEEEGEDLCNCEFSLAYGAKILLNNAKLRLKRGKRYGLCGGNGTGKSTLMRAIVNGQVEGFPPKTELKTVYVEHDIDGSMADMDPITFIYADPTFEGMPKEEIEGQLRDVGFTDELLRKGVAALSGGWKMKLALARAMLQKADILLLDEPTNHLDTNNVSWLQNYLVSLDKVTSIVVSHDTGFLDFICTNVLLLENRKIRQYRGNISEFVKQKPEARSLYELSASPISFKFPEPGFLEGVKTKDKAILKMQNVSFQYPAAEKPTLAGVSIYITLSSRVAVLGANGAGKSTMIRLLTGELEPNSGNIWKHPNLRIAYVAQHAFHHIEQHLDVSANQYIQWRYAIGEDREALQKVDRQITDEEAKKMAKQFNIDGQKRVIEKLVSRRKLKSSYEYEVQFQNCAADKNIWMSRDELVEQGFEKLVVEVDAKEAAAQGLMAKPLTSLNVQKHLEDFGLEPEFSTHSLMRGLSGGQKVKVVLGSAMWNNPHILVLDEPTNYLDRDSLGALAEAIKAYGGGVVMITHNKEFYSALTQETWLVADGKLMATGQNPLAGKAEATKFEVQEETTDAYGNVIKVKGPKKTNMSNKEKKAAEKLRKARKARGEEVTDSEEDA